MNDFALTHIVREPLNTAHARVPILILLHGVGSNEQDLMGLAAELDPRFLIVSVRAPISLQHGSYAWYKVEFTPQGYNMDPAEAVTSLKLLLRFIDEIAGAYNVDPDQLYLAGFSQGCIMSLGAAMTSPRKFAGVVGMSGRLLPDIPVERAAAQDMNGLPVMIVHGTRDSVIAIEYGRAIRDYLEKLPVDLTYKEYQMAHQVSRESLDDIREWLSAQLDRQTDWRGLPDKSSTIGS